MLKIYFLTVTRKQIYNPIEIYDKLKKKNAALRQIHI